MANEGIRAIDAGADMLHLDIMDGTFVANMTFGPPLIADLRKTTDAHFDCHVMITNPIAWVKPLADAGADTFTFHIEAMYDKDSEGEEVYNPEECNKKTYEMINEIRNAERKMRVGMTLRTDTDVKRLKPFLDSGDVDVVMVMTIPLGFGGQKFNADMMTKVSWLRTNYPDLDIEVDGGLGPATIE
jgi:ribulose-phosphate 3-epimerase